MWNLTEGKFITQGQEIEFDATDIYFLTGLSHRGEKPHMEGMRISKETLDALIARVCPGARKSSTSGKLQIPTVEDLTLRVLLFTIMRAVGSQAQHEATKTQLWLALDFFNSTMYDWVKVVSLNMKIQLTKCRRGETKQFGYGSILVPLMLEKVPLLWL